VTRFWLVLTLGAAAVWAEKKPVTLEVAAAPPQAAVLQPVWAPDGARFLYTEGGKVRLYDCAARSSRVLAVVAELAAKAAKGRPENTFQWKNRNVAEAGPQWSGDGKRILLPAGGDLFLVDPETGSFRQLTATAEAEEDPQLSPDGARVAYRTRNDLYVLSIDGGAPRRLTRDGGETLWNGRLDWVYPEELQLRKAWWWSPDGRSIAYLQFDVSAEMIHPHVDASPVQAVYEPQRFPKAGTPNASIRLGVVAASGGRTRWMDIGPTADTLIARVQWIPGSRELAVQRLTRVQDRLELMAFDVRTGRGRFLLEERDEAWINIHNILHFFADGRFLWANERDGFRHLYLQEPGGLRQVTRGDWEVVDLLHVDEARGEAWVTATKESPLERQVYRVKLADGTMTRETSTPGTHVVSVGPGARFYTDAWQNRSQPPRQVLAEASGRELAVIRDAPTQEHELLPVEYVTFRGKNGTLFHGQVIKPRGFDPSRRYPAVVMVYGGPHAQNVRDTWAGPNWEQALAQRGYVIWRMDNRGTNFRGHAFETPLNRQLGRVELADQLEGLDHLLAQGFVDPKRVGIYGWSYGGFMTLYAMTHAPDRFAAGIAGAPVTDWRHYDTIYTERYMGLPTQNATGYRNASPVKAADKLTGKLLLVHNFQDDNVLFQNSQHMMEALQKAGKQFESMFYPLKSHGVTGTLRLHLLRTTTEFLDRHLMGAGPGK
jgi:dipeptidyl-peptidase 4